MFFFVEEVSFDEELLVCFSTLLLLSFVEEAAVSFWVVWLQAISVQAERIVNDVTHNLCFMLNLLENVFFPLVYHESGYFKIG